MHSTLSYNSDRLGWRLGSDRRVRCVLGVKVGNLTHAVLVDHTDGKLPPSSKCQRWIFSPSRSKRTG
jgi:hypothetical protein